MTLETGALLTVYSLTQDDPASILDIKEDIRDECSKLGEVTNVVLYDKEPDGVVSVRFLDPQSARNCVQVCYAMTLPPPTIDAELTMTLRRR